MLRREMPTSARTELSELLRRMSKTGGSVTVSLDGRPIARIDGESPRAPESAGDREPDPPRAA